jgi:hypothetical protein
MGSLHPPAALILNNTDNRVYYTYLHEPAQRPAASQLLDEDGMVYHLVVPTRLWILVLEGVEAVWAGRNDHTVYGHYTHYTHYTCYTLARSTPVVAMQSASTEFYPLFSKAAPGHHFIV